MDAEIEPDNYRDLSRRPGFLIRRLHQIHLALFAEECKAFGVTPVQYSILTALEHMGAAEQIVLSIMIASQLPL